MAARKRETVDDTLSRLHALRAVLRADATDAAARDALDKSLASAVHLVVAKAADVVREAKLDALEKPLADAFARFLDLPPEKDKGCAAKFALAAALADLSVDAAPQFLRGVRLVQMEPAWGAPVDAAAGLRGACAAGLVNCGYRHALTELADLLMDPEPVARLGAARAISAWGREEGAPLLRMKALAGDPNTDVLGECLLGVIQLRSPGGVAFVGRFLGHRDPAVAEPAALALGESRHPDALTLLREAYARAADPEFRRVLLLCVAVTRLPQAIEFLLEEVATANPRPAADAVAALAVYKHDAALTARVKEKIDGRASKPLAEAFAEHFAAS